MATKLAARPGLPAEGPAPPGAGQGLLFLREEQLRLTQELLFFAHRDFAGAVDGVLADAGLGRAHHRALLFVGARPGINVSELLALLRITKQSLARVLGHLVAESYVEQRRGESDRREKHLFLTDRGRSFERRLFEHQREKLVAAFSEAGFAAVDGFRRVLRGLTDEKLGDRTSSERPVEKPAPERLMEKPAAERSGEKPAAERLGGKPAAERLAEKPAAERSGETPIIERLVKRPAAERPGEKPAERRLGERT